MRLIEELNLRIQRLQPLLDKLHDISQRMDDLIAQSIGRVRRTVPVA